MFKLMRFNCNVIIIESTPVSVASIQERFDAVLVLVMLEIVEFLERQLGVRVDVQVLEHPADLSLASRWETTYWQEERLCHTQTKRVLNYIKQPCSLARY